MVLEMRCCRGKIEKIGRNKETKEKEYRNKERAFKVVGCFVNS